MHLYLRDGTFSNTAKNVVSFLQLSNPILQKGSLSLTRCRLRSNGFNLRIREFVYSHGRKNPLEAADNMPFNNLRRDVCDENLLGDLPYSESVFETCKVEKNLQTL